MQISEYMWTDTSFFKFGVVGLPGLPGSNIVRGGAFKVSKHLLFVLQIEYNGDKQAKSCEGFKG